MCGTHKVKYIQSHTIIQSLIIQPHSIQKQWLITVSWLLFIFVVKWLTAQKMKFTIKIFFSKCDQTRSFLGIWSHLLKKSLIKNFFCTVTWGSKTIREEKIMPLYPNHLRLYCFWKCSILPKKVSLLTNVPKGLWSEGFLWELTLL